jgi:hypothetical protein
MQQSENSRNRSAIITAKEVTEVKAARCVILTALKCGACARRSLWEVCLGGEAGKTNKQFVIISITGRRRPSRLNVSKS